MNLNVRCVCLCLSYQFLRSSYIVQSLFINDRKPCALNREVHFENLYTSSTVDGRRQKHKEPMSFMDFLMPNRGPKKTHKYNPNVGYEPYWPAGDWVFSTAPNKTTKGIPNELCGQACPEMFKEYGPICGRNRNYQHKTFETYCDLMSEDCTLRSAWLVVYRGECQGDFKTYPTDSQLIITRAANHVSNFLYRHNSPDIILDMNLFDKLHKPTTEK